MGVVLEASLEGNREVERLISKLDPRREGVRWQREALLKAGLKVQEIAAMKKIRAGGALSGGRTSKPILGVLTSRTGTLRRSIAVDRGPLPAAVEVGTPLVYGGVHEKGGTFRIPQHSRHIGSIGRSGGSRAALVRAHTATFPKRPFMKPALLDVIPKLPGIVVAEINRELGRK